MLHPRHAAVIITPEGLLVVKDKNDKHLQKTIELIKQDPKKTTFQKDAAIEIAKLGKYSLVGGKSDPVDLVPGNPYQTGINTIIREIKEELSLVVEPNQIYHKVDKIKGRVRSHVIHLVRATGTIALNPQDSITGIGFIRQQNVFPLEHHFFQSHVTRTRTRYYNPGRFEKNQLIGMQYLSNITVSQHLLDEWFRDESRAYIYRGMNPKHGRPKILESSPNFTIVDSYGHPIHPFSDYENYDDETALFDSESSPPPPKAQLKKSPSTPKFSAIRPTDRPAAKTTPPPEHEDEDQPFDSSRSR